MHRPWHFAHTNPPGMALPLLPVTTTDALPHLYDPAPTYVPCGALPTAHNQSAVHLHVHNAPQLNSQWHRDTPGALVSQLLLPFNVTVL